MLNDMVDDVARDAVYGLRMLRRRPGFSAIVLTTLAVAIGATVTVFSIVDAWLLKPLACPQHDEGAAVRRRGDRSRILHLCVGGSVPLLARRQLPAGTESDTHRSSDSPSCGMIAPAVNSLRRGAL